MKIFDDGGKINFVDQNDVYVGYDMCSNCCENYGWFIADEPTLEIKDLGDEQAQNWDEWYFDIRYFLMDTPENFDSGGMAIFRITNGKDCKYIHLYNDHNGYYAHGFKFGEKNITFHDGSL